MTPFIVAEIATNWVRQADGSVTSTRNMALCEQFEEIIETNRQRGYVLYQFQLHRMMTSPDILNETIIAVFERTVQGDLLASMRLKADR